MWDYFVKTKSKLETFWHIRQHSLPWHIVTYCDIFANTCITLIFCDVLWQYVTICHNTCITFIIVTFLCRVLINSVAGQNYLGQLVSNWIGPYCCPYYQKTWFSFEYTKKSRVKFATNCKSIKNLPIKNLASFD